MKLLSVRWNGLWVAVIALGSFILLGTSSLRHNLCYLAVVSENWDCAYSPTLTVGRDSNLVDARLVFRLSVHDGNWMQAGELAPIAIKGGIADEWLLLWVIRSIQPQLDRGEISAVEPALDFVRTNGSANPQVWYALGQAYEAGGLAKQRTGGVDSLLFDGTLAYEDNTWFDRAAQAYRAGLVIDANGPWSEGTYHLAMLNYHQARWRQVILVLESVLANATDKQIKQKIRGTLNGGPDWQEVFILLGQSYQQIGEEDAAMKTWQRMVTTQGANQDWTLNVGLRALGEIEARQSQFDSAFGHLAQALDIAFTFPDDYRVAYVQATWADILDVVRYTHQQIGWPQAKNAAESLSTRFPTRASVWYILGVFKEAECQHEGVVALYAKAQRLMQTRSDELSAIFSTSDSLCLNEE